MFFVLFVLILCIGTEQCGEIEWKIFWPKNRKTLFIKYSGIRPTIVFRHTMLSNPKSFSVVSLLGFLKNIQMYNVAFMWVNFKITFILYLFNFKIIAYNHIILIFLQFNDFSTHYQEIFKIKPKPTTLSYGITNLTNSNIKLVPHITTKLSIQLVNLF